MKIDLGRDDAPHVGLFVTCLVDLMRPSIGFAAVKLLRDAGCTVGVPVNQTCCGQPAYNSGDRRDALGLAKQTIEALEGFDYVVVPSGSCAGMLKHHYPELLRDDPQWSERAEIFSSKVYELVSFLVDVLKIEKLDASVDASVRAGIGDSVNTRIGENVNTRVTYHDSCAGLRELGIKDQPRKLLAMIEGINLVEMTDSEVCCGFGGTFAMKYGDISNAMVEKKTANIAADKPDLLLAGDLGCLMNMAGKLRRQGRAIDARHIAEVLAGDMTTPAIGAGAAAITQSSQQPDPPDDDRLSAGTGLKSAGTGIPK